MIDLQDEPAEQPAPESEAPVEQESPGVTDTPETVEETDEQKNARELAEREERSKRRAKGIEKRFAELTADKYAERQRAERAERIAEELQRKLSGQPAQPTEGKGPPRKEDYADFDAWVEAKAEYVAEQKALAIVERREREMQEAQQRQAAQQYLSQVETQHQQRLSSYLKSHPDFSEAAEAHDVFVNDVASTLIKMMDDGPAVVHAIAKAPELANRLNSAPPHMQGVILGEIAAKLKDRPPQVSKAPAPGAPVSGKATSAKRLEEIEDVDEWLKARERQLKRR